MKKFLSKKSLIDSKKRCKKYRLKILEMSQNVSALHIGGTFSCTEIFDTIFNLRMLNLKILFYQKVMLRF